MRRGFTLVEMLVVIGILAILIGIGMKSFSSSVGKAEKAKAQELVSNVATALEAIYQKEGSWPRRLLSEGSSDGELTAEVGYEIAKRGLMSLSRDDDKKKLIAADRCGIVTPWAQKVINKAGNGGVSDGTAVPGGSTIKKHRLHFAIDTEGLGFVNASVGGESIRIRGSAAVWCCGKDGEIYGYSEGRRKDNVYSWSDQQRKK